MVYILKLIAGTGLFLFAMYLIEDAVRNLSGRSFKLFLQRITKNDLGAVLGGIVVTAVLQSSSMISMMVLAFVGAGIFTLRNAMAVILGANLGTTLASWIVATLGFMVDIDIAAYPAVGAGGLMLALASNRNSIIYTAYLLLGFGCLFISLDFMKEAMAGRPIDFSAYSDLPMIAYLAFGFIFTLLIQSSSVTMALTLSALHNSMISFPVAAVIVLGSETGTSIKLLLAAVGDDSTKKRVALGNLLFNVVLTLMIFLMLHQILWIVTDWLTVSDPMLRLVSFSSLVNLLTIIVFLPLLRPLTALLERFYRSEKNGRTPFLAGAAPENLAPAFIQETAFFIYTSLRYNGSLLAIRDSPVRNAAFDGALEKMHFFSKTQVQQYEHLKHVQGTLQAILISKLASPDELQQERKDALSAAIRNCMYAVKSMNDICVNISNLKRSSKDAKYQLYADLRKATAVLYHKFDELLWATALKQLSGLSSLLSGLELQYKKGLDDFFKRPDINILRDTDITTAINFNREVYTSHKAMAQAVDDFLTATATSEPGSRTAKSIIEAIPISS